MVLSDRDIKKRLKEKSIVIKPYDPTCLQPSSIDLHLGHDFLVFDTHDQTLIDTKKSIQGLMKRIEIGTQERLIIHPREFILGTTVEWLKIPRDLVGRLEGKSSLGRIGIIIHSTAGFFDPGFEGQATLEISNLSNLPIALYKGMRIGQMSFIQMTGPAETVYGDKKLKSHYKGQLGATPSKLVSVWGKK